MLYCSKCRRLTDQPRCPECKNKALRAVTDNDVCLLTQKQPMWGEMLEEVLRNNGIAYEIRSGIGAGLAMYSPGLEWYEYYVRYADLEAAQHLVDELFGVTEAEEDEADDTQEEGAENPEQMLF